MQKSHESAHEGSTGDENWTPDFAVLLARGFGCCGRRLPSSVSPPQLEEAPGTKYEGFVLVQGGSFQMGDVWGDSPWAMSEVPVHEVQVDDFLLAKHETTVAEFERFVKATGHKTVAGARRRNSGEPGFPQGWQAILSLLAGALVQAGLRIIRWS